MTNLIEETAEKIKTQIKVCLQYCRQINVTTDLWSTRCSNESFIGVTTSAFNYKARKRQSFKLCTLSIFN